MYKLAISNTVVFPVKGTVRDGDKNVEFEFDLEARRETQDQVTAALSGEDGDTRTSDYLAARVTGWRRQRLVLDEAGQPAAFSPEALAFLFTLTGMPTLAFRAYLAAVGAKGKEKN